MSSLSSQEYLREYRQRPEVRAAHVRQECARQRRKRDRLNQIKLARGCTDCGYNRHPEALHFDHLLDFPKLFSVGGALSKSWTRIEQEIAKCEVVCANCHAIRTAERRTA